MRIYGENDKEGKMRWCGGVQERLSVQRETVREEVFLSEQAATSKEKTRRTWEPQTSQQITFPGTESGALR